MKILITVFLITFTIQSSESKENFQSTEFFGDSLTAGLLSDVSLKNPPPFKIISKIMNEMTAFLIDDDLEYIRKREIKNNSWAKLASEVLHLPSTNYAYTGATLTGLHEQIQKSQLNTNHMLSFFFIGNNDISHQESEIDIVKNYYENLRIWNDSKINSTAVIIPIAKIDEVFHLLWDYVWYYGTKRNYTCKDSWQFFFPYGRVHYFQKKKDLQMTQLKNKIESVNQKIESLVVSLNLLSDSKNRNNQFIYLKEASDENYLEKYFSIDCYHLSEEGQKRMSEIILNALKKKLAL